MHNSVNERRLGKLLAKLNRIITRRNLNPRELVLLCGNLCYFVGAAIGGYTGKTGPSLEELQTRYYTEPTLDVALMLQGLTVASWADNPQLKISPRLSNQVK
jgi:hypothetical protein